MQGVTLPNVSQKASDPSFGCVPKQASTPYGSRLRLAGSIRI